MFIYTYVYIYIWLDLAQHILVHTVENILLGISSFRLVLQAMSLSRSGPGAVHKKFAQETFVEKWKAGSTHAKTYPVFVGSCR